MAAERSTILCATPLQFAALIFQRYGLGGEAAAPFSAALDAQDKWRQAKGEVAQRALRGSGGLLALTMMIPPWGVIVNRERGADVHEL